jgi:hypothetical protein
MFEFYGVGEGVSMKDSIDIEQSSSLIIVRLIRNNLTIKKHGDRVTRAT